MADLSKNALISQLSLPFPGPSTRRAAEHIYMASDPSAVFADLFPNLLSAKVLHTALRHLDEAGCDLAQLHIPGERCLTSWPADMDLVWPPDPPSFVFQPEPRPPRRRSRLGDLTAGALQARLGRHRRLLSSNVVSILDQVGPDCFALLSGGAFDARFPDYHTRMAYDTDVIVPDLAAAKRLTEVAVGLGGQLVGLQLHHMPGPSISARGAIAWQAEDHLVTFSFETGGAGRLRGSLWERSTPVSWQDRLVRAVSPEDLLLLMAAKHRTGSGFGHKDAADLLVIVAGEQLDRHYIAEISRTEKLQLPLLVLLASGRGIAPAQLPPIWRTAPFQVAKLKWRKTRRRALRRSLEKASEIAGLDTAVARIGRVGVSIHPVASACAVRPESLDLTGCPSPGSRRRKSRGEAVAFIRSLPTSGGFIPHRCERFTVDRRLLT